MISSDNSDIKALGKIQEKSTKRSLQKYNLNGGKNSARKIEAHSTSELTSQPAAIQNFITLLELKVNEQSTGYQMWSHLGKTWCSGVEKKLKTKNIYIYKWQMQS